MSLEPGQELLHYRIVDKIGAGGMGVVWKARDTTLERDVAIKLLPDHVGQDPDQRARFHREAKTLATLNHPGIAAVYGMHDATTAKGTVSFIAMELVEGDELADHIGRGPIRIDRTIAIAAQLAEALDVAHQRGIVHRDLKPANIKIDPEGKVRVLDFGLAKSVGPQADSTSADVTVQPTISLGETAVGMIVGTAAYMSPEQARGEPVDKRTDIWAFGIVLWEMLTGERLFAAATVTDALAGVLQKPVPMDGLPAKTPPALRRLLERCLARDTDKRLRDIGDARAELEAAREELAAGPTVEGPRSAASRPRAWLVLLAVVAVVAFAVGRFVSDGDADGATPGPTTPLHASITLPEGQRIAGWASPTLAYSKDGSKLAYVATNAQDENHLFIRHLDRGETVQVPDSLTAEGPFFSPDGDWLGFAVGVSGQAVASPELKKYSLKTGLTQSITPLLDWFGGVWQEDDTIWFVGFINDGLKSVPASGGAPERLLDAPVFAEGAPETYAWPQAIPGTDLVIVTLWRGLLPSAGVIDLSMQTVSSLDGVAAAFVRWIPTGHLVFVFPDGDLQIAPFDIERREISGPLVAMMDGLSLGANQGPVLTFDDHGTLAFSRGQLRDSGTELQRIVRLGAGQDPELLPFPVAQLGNQLRVSLDGQRLVASRGDGRPRIYDLDRGTSWELGGCRLAWRLTWSPDSNTVFCSDYSETLIHLRQDAVDGAGPVGRSLHSSPHEMYVLDVSPDGERLLFLDSETWGARELPLDGTGDLVTLFTDEGLGSWMRYSPDGQRIAYVSGRTGRDEAWLRSVSGSGAAVMISVGGADRLAWAPGGDRVYYEQNDKIYAVTVGPGDATIGKPEFVLDLADVVSWDAAGADGEFIALQRVPGSGEQTEIHLVFNWFDEVRRLANGR